MLKKVLIGFLGLSLLFGCAKKQEEPQPQAQVKVDTRMFSLPKFADLFNSFDYLQKSDFDKALSNKYSSQPNDVFLSSFNLGVMTADAIIATKSRNKTKLSEIATAMIENSKLIGVKEDVLKLADDLVNMIQQDKWDELQTTLDKYKSEVELSLYETQQFDLLTLVQIGGWTQGLNRMCFLINTNYKPEKTVILDQKGIVETIIQNTKKIENPEIKNKPWFAAIEKNYTEIQNIVKPKTESTFTNEETKKLYEVSKAILDAVK